MTPSARLVGVGVFIIAGVALFTVALFMIGDRQMAFTRRFTLYTEFARVSGLQPGTYYFKCDIHPQMKGTYVVKG